MTPTSKILSEMARAAGREVMAYFRQTKNIQDKGNHLGLVTEADLASEKLLKEAILRRYPDHSVLAEESGLHRTLSHKDRSPIWVIDPLDGTNNFAHGNRYFCISIAFACESAAGNEVLSAAIYQPTADLMFTADRGAGAYCNGEKMTISSQTDFRKGMYCTGWAASKGEGVREVVEQIYRVQSSCLSTAVRMNGAAALDLANTAYGVFDGFWEKNLNPWDLAAGALLVEEAGGVVQNYQGEFYDGLRDRDIFATNVDLMRPLRQAVLERA